MDPPSKSAPPSTRDRDGASPGGLRDRDSASPGGLRARPQGGRVVALTGASSFLGRNLVGVLEDDPDTRRIVAIDVKAPDTSGPKTRMYPVDLTAPASEERVAEILA